MQIFHKCCKPAASNKDNYSEAERQQILDYLSDKTDPYAMAIKLAFYLPLRISEMCSIKYCDIDGRLNITRARRTSEEMDDNLQFSNRQITNGEMVPLGDISDFEDIANAVWFLGTEQSKNISGTELVIDGAMSVQLYPQLLNTLKQERLERSAEA